MISFMKNIKSIIIFFFALLLIACGNISSSNRNDDEMVNVEVEEVGRCRNCNGVGYVTVDCSHCFEGEKCQYVSETRPTVCEDCDGFGVVKCEMCEEDCISCDGYGEILCAVCRGSGVFKFYDGYDVCPRCDGGGTEVCILCDGSGINACHDPLGVKDCETCWGSGSHGVEEYSFTIVDDCEHCNGIGSFRRNCRECDGTGEVVEKKIVPRRN